MDEARYENEEPVQDSWPDLTCYGCGPANDDGHQLKSYLGPDGDSLVATVDPDERFNSGAPNVMYGGHVASLIDCHSVWTAITFAYRAENRPLDSEPQISYVTANLCVDYHRPTPLDRPVQLTARVDGDVGRKTRIETELGADGETTATAEVLAIRVPSDGRTEHRR